MGTAFLAVFAVVVVRASAPFAPYAAAFGLASCLWCALVLHRQFRARRAQRERRAA